MRNNIISKKARIWNWQIVRLSNIECLKSSFIWLICENKTFKLFLEDSLIFTFLTYTVETSEDKSMSDWLSLALDTTCWIEIDESRFNVKWV